MASRVLLHALGANMGGALRHITRFLPALSEADSSREYVVLIRSSLAPPPAGPNVTFEPVADRTASGLLPRLAYDALTLPRRLRREKFGAVVTLTNLGPIWTPAPHVLFQRNALYFCDGARTGLHGLARAEVIVRRQMAVAAMQRAARIVTPSHAMADLIRRTCPELAHRPFRTLYHGFDLVQEEAPLDEAFQRTLDFDGLRLFYPAHPAPHKGFELLFDALAALKQRGVPFRLLAPISYSEWPAVVGPYEQRRAALGLENDVRFIGRVPQTQMAALYRGADMVVYPSLCESFGFPLLEALGYGCPIVAADTPLNREIVGAHARFYPLLDPSALADAIESLAAPHERRRLAAGGLAHLAQGRWGWTRYAREFIALLDEVC